MNEPTIEPIVDVPLEELMVEVAPLDAIHEIHILREINRRWRLVAIGSIFVAVLLGIVSVVQFAGTFITCRLLKETREEASRNRKDAQQSIQRLQDAEILWDILAKNALDKFDRGNDELNKAHVRLERIFFVARNHEQDRKLLQQLEIDVAEARENLIAVETMRLLLEKDEEARARIDPRTYGDPKERCPYDPQKK